MSKAQMKLIKVYVKFSDRLYRILCVLEILFISQPASIQVINRGASAC